MTCNYCLGTMLADHKCREKGLEINCPICCDFLFTSSATVRGLPCGHYMHSDCFRVGWFSVGLLLLVSVFMFAPFFLVSFRSVFEERHVRRFKFLFIVSGVYLQSLHLPNL